MVVPLARLAVDPSGLHENCVVILSTRGTNFRKHCSIISSFLLGPTFHQSPNPPLPLAFTYLFIYSSPSTPRVLSSLDRYSLSDNSKHCLCILVVHMQVYSITSLEKEAASKISGVTSRVLNVDVVFFLENGYFEE